MKLANHRGRATVMTDGGGIDVATASSGRFGPTMQSVYDDWNAFVREAPNLSGDATPVADSELLAPSPFPRQVFAIGINYQLHADEGSAEVPTKPATFTKFPTCISGPFSDVVLPAEARVDWEVELVVVIGAKAAHVSEADAWKHVAGLTVGQDVSDRKLQFAAGMQFSLGKSHRGFGPMGPWLCTPDEFANPADLALGCAINGERMQESRTSEMIFDVPRLIAEISRVTDMLPGDVIFTGTPEGVGVARDPRRFLRDGEVLESWIEGIGTIRNRMVAAS